MSDLDKEVNGWRASLFDVEERFRQASIEYHTQQKFLLRFWHLQDKFNMLQLIVERIRDELKLMLPQKKNTKRYFHFLIYLEAYFYFLVSSLDILAKLAPCFYSKWEGNEESKKYFSHQRDFFKKHPEKDQEFARYLDTNMGWFDKVRLHRNELTHNGALFIFPTSTKKFYFGTIRNKKGFIPNEEVEACIVETFKGFCGFLIYYNSHFGAKTLQIPLSINPNEALKRENNLK
jgi:hypothetical protein